MDIEYGCNKQYIDGQLFLLYFNFIKELVYIIVSSIDK